MTPSPDKAMPDAPKRRDTDPHGWAVECIEAVLHQLRQYDKEGDILLGPEIFDLDDALKCLALTAPSPVEVTPEQVGKILAETKKEWWREQWYRDFAEDLNKHGLTIIKRT